MTDKLYYKDAYIKDFEADILSSEHDGKFYKVVLDRTAFFPEEGGQSADSGTIGGAAVIDVREEQGVIYHLLEVMPEGTHVRCELDFNARFEKMQCHTAEHILCGIIHKLHGYENVGFHLGDDAVTFDVDGELTASEIENIERLANRAVFDNRRVTTVFPSASELEGLEYRSKLDLVDNVRIVNIDGIDSCACCAPHVAYTGEIGVIKIVDFMRHRGGMRLFMQAGYRAISDYQRRYEITRHVGALTSTPSLETDAVVDRLIAERDKLAAELSSLSILHARALADAVEPTEGNSVKLLEFCDAEAMRELANRAAPRVGGMLVVLSGNEGNYRYVIASATKNLRELSKEINSSLSGKGGGRPEMISGSFATDLHSIKAYFEK